MKVNTAVGLVLGCLGVARICTAIAGHVGSGRRAARARRPHAAGIYTASPPTWASTSSCSHDPSGGESPGRMGVNTAVCLTALGAAYTVGVAGALDGGHRGAAGGGRPAQRVDGSHRRLPHRSGGRLPLGRGHPHGRPHRAGNPVARRRAAGGRLASGGTPPRHLARHRLAGCVAGITLVVWMGGRAIRPAARRRTPATRPTTSPGWSCTPSTNWPMRSAGSTSAGPSRAPNPAAVTSRVTRATSRSCSEIGWVEAANRVVSIPTHRRRRPRGRGRRRGRRARPHPGRPPRRPSTGSRDAILLGRGDELFLRLGRGDGDGVLVASIDLGRFLERLGIVTGQAARVAVAIKERRVLPTAGGAPLTPSTDAVEAHRVILGARWMVQVDPPPTHRLVPLRLAAARRPPNRLLRRGHGAALANQPGARPGPGPGHARAQPPAPGCRTSSTPPPRLPSSPPIRAASSRCSTPAPNGCCGPGPTRWWAGATPRSCTIPKSARPAAASSRPRAATW